MRCWAICRFEIACQSRRVSTWLYFPVLLALTYHMTREIYIDNARSNGYFFNAPFVIAVMTFYGSMMGLRPRTCRAGSFGDHHLGRGFQ
jgi:ABC-2 type transport system permease protein